MTEQQGYDLIGLVESVLRHTDVLSQRVAIMQDITMWQYRALLVLMVFCVGQTLFIARRMK